MPTISSPGLGSGLDVRGIVSQLVELEKRPLLQLQKKAETTQLRLSALGEIKARVAALDDALRQLTRGSTFRDKAVQSSNAAVTGSALFTALPATYAVTVSQLARGQTVQSAALPVNTSVGSGVLTIEMGRWSGLDSATPVFTEDTERAPLSITVTATDTLTTIAQKINDANGAVSASVINDGTGQRLVLRSRATGEAEGFRIQVADDDGDANDGLGLSRLAFDPANIGAGNGLALGQAAQDTVASIDGVEVRSANATLNNAIPGVSLTLSATTSTPVTVQVTANTATARKALEAFVTAYNELESLLSDALRYDPRTRTAGPLQGDATMVAFQANIRRLLGEVAPDGRTLSDIGIELGRDGRLSIRDDRLNAALANPTALQEALAGATEAQNGIAQRWRDVTTAALRDDGRLSLRRTALESEIDRLKRQEERLNEKVARTEQRLLAQFTRLDSNIARLNAINAYVAQQVTQWNRKTE